MRSIRYRLLTLAVAATALSPSLALAQTFEYPETKRVDHVDVYHGVEVADPYRWLENDVRESAPVSEWVEAQNRVTFDYLEGLPGRERIRQRLEALWNFEKFDVPRRVGGRYYFSKNDGLQNQYVLYTMRSLDEEPRVLIDPNGWSEDGTVALAGTAPSPDGKYLAYGIQDGGSDWRTWRVMEVETGRVLEDELEWIKFSGVEWSRDGKGFYYGRYPRPEEGAEFQSLNVDMKLYYHRVGTPQEEDRVVFEQPEHPDWGYGAEVTDDGRYLVITVWKGTDARYRIFVDDLKDEGSGPVALIDNFDHEYTLAGSDGSSLFFMTNRDAGRRRVVAIDVDSPQRESWSEIVPQSAATMVAADVVGDALVIEYLEDAKTRVSVHELDGAHRRDVELPGIGSAYGFDGERGDEETFYYFSSFATPPSVYRYDVGSGKSSLFARSEVDFDPAGYEVEQVFYASKDGTRVPMFVAHRKGLELDGENPTLLYGYGGFDIPLTPSFSISRLAWMEMGGVFAMANLRGGGEYGEAWHKAGTKLQKQNVFDDFIAAGEWLIANGYTSKEHLGIQGGSNGGLLVGAAMTQRPDLFAVALPAVGVMDMLRFHKFTAGRFWVDDYGSAEDPEEFEALRAYSPYHNLEHGVDYPATLVTTADFDDRVVPGHSFKFAAALQAAHSGKDPVLIRIETRAGHGAGTPTSKLIERVADQWAFLAHHTELGWEIEVEPRGP